MIYIAPKSRGESGRMHTGLSNVRIPVLSLTCGFHALKLSLCDVFGTVGQTTSLVRCGTTSRCVSISWVEAAVGKNEQQRREREVFSIEVYVALCCRRFLLFNDTIKRRTESTHDVSSCNCRVWFVCEWDTEVWRESASAAAAASGHYSNVS